MTKIYMIRHAEAEGNLYRRGQGHFDGKITLQGRKQIEALAERFRDVKIDALYSSDLSRTQATAGAILKYHPELELIIEPRLREVCMGIWEDKAWGNLAYYEAEQLSYFSHDPEKWSVEGCESFSDLKVRMFGIVRELAAENDGKTIAAVSHGMAIRTLLAAIMGIKSEEINKIPHSDNTAVSLLSVENGEITVEFFNDNSHLPEEISTFAKQTWWKEKSGADRKNLRFEPINLKTDSEDYANSYAETWSMIHGDLSDFDRDYYLSNAYKHAKKHPEALMKVVRDDEFIGVIDVDTERAKEDNAGWISFCFLTEDNRGERLGVQLLGHAVSLFRKLGRKSIRLHVAETNKRAISFYTHYGFKKIGEVTRDRGTLILMEMEI